MKMGTEIIAFGMTLAEVIMCVIMGVFLMGFFIILWLDICDGIRSYIANRKTDERKAKMMNLPGYESYQKGFEMAKEYYMNSWNDLEKEYISDIDEYQLKISELKEEVFKMMERETMTKYRIEKKEEKKERGFDDGLIIDNEKAYWDQWDKMFKLKHKE